MSRVDQLIAALDQTFFELSTDGKILYASPATDSWTNANKPSGFVGFLESAEHKRFEQAFRRVTEGKARQSVLETVWHLPKQNDGVPVELRMAGLHEQGETVTSVAIYLRDISLEKASEAAANVQGTHLLDLVEHVSDACVIESADGMVEMVNAAFCDLFAIKEAPQSLIGIPAKQIFENAARESVNQIGPVYFQMDSTEADTLVFSRLSGQNIVQLSRPVANAEGIAGRLHLFRPTESAPSRDQPDGNSETTVKLATIKRIARELSNTVEGTASALFRAEQLELPSTVIEHLRQVQTSACAAFDAMANITDFSRVDAAELQLESAPFSLRESLAQLIERITPLFRAHQIQLKVQVSQDVPNQLTGDGARLLLAIHHLMECSLHDEAGRYCQGAAVQLLVEPEYVADHNIHLNFTIEISLPKGLQRSKSLSPAGALQLAMTRQIVRAMAEQASEKSARKVDLREKRDGLVWQFTAVMPFTNDNVPVNRPTFVTLTGMPLLIVSSDEVQRKEWVELARSWRMQPHEADDVSVALYFLSRMAIEQSPVPLVITANELPLQDGFLLAFRVKNHPLLKSTAVVMLTQSGKPGDSIQCRENGISAYLRLPISPDQLRDALATIMGAEAESDATSTLVTRHSLREASEGTVLIVDHQRDHSTIAANALRKADFRVLVAETAESAFEMMQQDEIDVILLEPQTPGFTRLQPAATQLRNHMRKDRSPVVLLAKGSQVNVDENRDIDGTIQKPFDREALIRRISALMPKRQPA